MTTQELKSKELRELDDWIENRVFGRKLASAGYSWLPESKHYTTNAADSDALDDKILEANQYAINFSSMEKKFVIWQPDGEVWATHSDKKICRAMFAKKLFSK